MSLRLRTMPKFPFPCLRYRTVFGSRRVAVASTILFNSKLYKKFKNRKACFTLIVPPFVRAFLPQVTERRDREADHRQFHTESQNVRQPYDVRTIISRHMQGCPKMVMQNLQDCRKTKRYVVRFPLCSRAIFRCSRTFRSILAAAL